MLAPLSWLKDYVDIDVSDPEEAFERCKTLCELVVVTRGENGAVAIKGEERYS